MLKIFWSNYIQGEQIPRRPHLMNIESCWFFNVRKRFECNNKRKIQFLYTRSILFTITVTKYPIVIPHNGHIFNRWAILLSRVFRLEAFELECTNNRQITLYIERFVITKILICHYCLPSLPCPSIVVVPH
jgi:hypothetical protein